ncbi:MAG: NYN domain-containing protein [Pleurocapsa sp.]
MLDLSKNAPSALLIDADNINSCKEIELVLAELSSLDQLIIKRAYGDWFTNKLKSWKSILAHHEIEPIHSLVTSTSGKNATDIRLVIDAMDFLYNRQIDWFYIVSSDRDFTPLVRRLKQQAKYVIGFGKKNSAPILKNSYHQFITIEALAISQSVTTSHVPVEATVKTANPVVEKVSNQGQKTITKPFKKELLEITQAAYKKVSLNNDWVTIGQLEPHLKKICEQKMEQSFSCKLFGCKRLVQLINEVGIFEWDTKQPSSKKTKSKRIRLKQIL